LVAGVDDIHEVRDREVHEGIVAKPESPTRSIAGQRIPVVAEPALQQALRRGFEIRSVLDEASRKTHLLADLCHRPLVKVLIAQLLTHQPRYLVAFTFQTAEKS